MDQLPFYQRPFRFRYFNAAIVIIGLNVFVFLAARFLEPRIAGYLAMTPALVVRQRWWWQIVTYMFAHIQIGHLITNMFGLFFFGIQLERKLGSVEFLLYYLLTGALSALFSLGMLWVLGAPGAAVFGASAGVFAVLLAYATYFPTARVLVFGILPMSSVTMVLAYTAIVVISMFTGRGTSAHPTDLAGLVFGFFYLLLRLRINPIREFTGTRRY